jgi:hypothetical protein
MAAVAPAGTWQLQSSLFGVQQFMDCAARCPPALDVTIAAPLGSRRDKPDRSFVPSRRSPQSPPLLCITVQTAGTRRGKLNAKFWKGRDEILPHDHRRSSNRRHRNTIARRQEATTTSFDSTVFAVQLLAHGPQACKDPRIFVAFEKDLVRLIGEGRSGALRPADQHLPVSTGDLSV